MKVVILGVCLFSILDFSLAVHQDGLPDFLSVRVARSLSSLKGITRKKREAPLIHDSSCSLQCTLSMQNELTTNENFKDVDMDDLSSIQASTKFSEFDVDQLKEICGLFQRTKDCFDNCTDGSNNGFLDTLADTFSITDYICVEHFDEFVKHIPCYNSTQDKMLTQCMPECDGFSVLGAMEGMGDGNDIPGMIGKMGDLCEFGTCMVDCQQDITQEKCGEDAAKLITEFSNLAFKKLLKIFTVMGIGCLLPPQCQAFGVDGEAQPFSLFNMLAGPGGPPLGAGPDEDLDAGPKLRDFVDFQDFPERGPPAGRPDLEGLQIEVLEKESQKLDLEMEKLRLEMMVLERKLQEK